MSATKTLHPDEKIKAGKLGGRMFKIGGAAGVALLVIGVIGLVPNIIGRGCRPLEPGFQAMWPSCSTTLEHADLSGGPRRDGIVEGKLRQNTIG